MNMIDEAISLLSIWASMNSWLTPTFLFLFLNLMIGTILITSTFNSSKPQHDHDHDVIVHPTQQPQPPSQISRAPSVIQRLKSINFYSYYSQNSSPVSDPLCNSQPELDSKKFPAQIQTSELELKKVPRRVNSKFQTQIQTQTQTWVPSIEEDFPEDEGPTIDEIYNQIKGISSTQHHRQSSDTLPVTGNIPARLPAKMNKSASDRSAFTHFQKANESENEMDEREMIAAAMAIAADGGGAEVDARADDFINRFKKQLLLQRNESILQYKDMITRFNAK